MVYWQVNIFFTSFTKYSCFTKNFNALILWLIVSFYFVFIVLITAEAVPCAIYAFLSHFNKNFEELILFAISLGGDTDTIASMAGAMAGAYFGRCDIPEDWIDNCEGVSNMISLADSLYDLVEHCDVRT